MRNTGNKLRIALICGAAAFVLLLGGLPSAHNGLLHSPGAYCATEAGAVDARAADGSAVQTGISVGVTGAIGGGDAAANDAGSTAITYVGGLDASGVIASVSKVAGAGRLADAGADAGAGVAGTGNILHLALAEAAGTGNILRLAQAEAAGTGNILRLAQAEAAGNSGGDAAPDAGNSGANGTKPEVKELSLEDALALAHEHNSGFKLLALSKEQAKIEASQASSQADKIDFDNPFILPTLQTAQAKYVNDKAKAAAKVKADKNYEVYQNALELQITQKYYAVLEAAEVLKVKEAALKRAEQQFKNAEAAHKVGIAAKTEVLGAEAVLAGVRADQTNAKNQYEIAVVELNRTIGLDLDTRLSLTSTVELAPLEEIDLGAVTEKALEERADIIAAVKDKEVAEENYNVSVSYTARNTYVSRLAKVGLDMTAINLEETEKNVQAELLSSHLNVTAAWEALGALEGSVKVRAEVMRLTELRYDVGLATTLDILQASEQLMETEVAYVQAVHRYNLAKLAFETAKVFPVSPR